ncbi:DUF4197 domain-containing protein [Pinibacter soli]|uniref:DUF4197 domain-containing protein n=1 Tax=Pinibacter soli TaxID=3044211 RepID=A0ABT6R8B4_9BACT|nr:DUF4197 domain-containing protein [Pinibacter soli]MDI3318804.1 DUF4197 domain-containing protein [Pinibacter soli]
MKIWALAIPAMALFSSCETLQLPQTSTGTGTTTTKSSGAVTENDAAQGIREALTQGITKAVSTLNVTNGFLGNQAYKVLLPPDAVKVENTLRTLGMGAQVDKAITQINRAAEDAVGQATPIFVNAIKQMSITDALNIVKGGNNSVTNYFKDKTSSQLLAAFAPNIKQSLDKVSATKYYADIVNVYNKLPTTVQKINPDLQNYVAGKATDALFDQIAKEEVAIRTDPMGQASAILQKVFGK